jgi:Fe(3+) dicitrate transport protein
VRLETTAFYLAFTNQIIEPSTSAGTVAQAALANQGATRHRGVEASVLVDWGRVARLPIRVETGLGYTFVEADFSDDRFLERSPGDTVNIRGNRLPYAPRYLLSASLEVAWDDRLGLRLDGLRVGAQLADNFETRAPSPNGRNGLIPAYGLVNVAGWWTVPGWSLRVVGTVKNLFDDTYIASRRPEGIKPGLPRFIQLGLEVGL